MKQKQAALLIKDKQIIISRLDKGDLHSNLALCLVLKILFPSLLNHVLCTSLHVPAVELVILVKPIGIFTHVLMNIFFGTKIHMFLNILIVPGIVGTVVMPPVLKLLILLRSSHNLKSRRVFILNG